MKNKNTIILIALSLLIFVAVITINITIDNNEKIYRGPYYTIDTVPEYKYDSYVVINNNIPEFDENSITQTRL